MDAADDENARHRRKADGDSTLYLRLVNDSWTPPGSIGKTKRRMLLEGSQFTTQDAEEWTKLVQTTLTAVQVFHAAIINEMNRMVDAGTLSDRRQEPFLHRNHSRDQTGDKLQPPPESSDE